MERRDFLRYFGIGSTIVPLIGMMPDVSHSAKLIEEPKIELVRSLPEELLRAGPCKMTIASFTAERDKREWAFECLTMVNNVIRSPWSDVTSHASPGRYREYIPSLIDHGEITITVKILQTPTVR